MPGTEGQGWFLVAKDVQFHPGGSTPTHCSTLSPPGRGKMLLPLNQVRIQGSRKPPCSLPVPVGSVCRNKALQAGSLIMPMYHSQLWRLQVQDHGAGMAGFW